MNNMIATLEIVRFVAAIALCVALFALAVYGLYRNIKETAETAIREELSQDNGKSEMQAYAWDLETNTMSVQNFTNPHAKEVRGKIKTLTSLRDIYENNANMAGRRLAGLCKGNAIR